MKPSPLTEASASIYIYTSRLKFTWDEMASTTRHSELSRAWRASFNIASATEASTWSSPSLRHSFGTTEASASTTLDLSIKGMKPWGSSNSFGWQCHAFGGASQPGLVCRVGGSHCLTRVQPTQQARPADRTMPKGRRSPAGMRSSPILCSADNGCPSLQPFGPCRPCFAVASRQDELYAAGGSLLLLICLSQVRCSRRSAQ